MIGSTVRCDGSAECKLIEKATAAACQRAGIHMVSGGAGIIMDRRSSSSEEDGESAFVFCE